MNATKQNRQYTRAGPTPNRANLENCGPVGETKVWGGGQYFIADLGCSMCGVPVPVSCLVSLVHISCLCFSVSLSACLSVPVPAQQGVSGFESSKNSMRRKICKTCFIYRKLVASCFLRFHGKDARACAGECCKFLTLCQ